MAPLDLLSITPRLEYISDLLVEQRVLCLGGHGWEALVACRLGALQSLFLDPSPQRIAYASKRCAHENAMTLQAPLWEMPLEDACIDVVLLSGLPDTSEERRAHFTEIRRVLTEDGFLLVSLEKLGAKQPIGRLNGRGALEANADLRADLRRFFPHVELLTQRHGLSIYITPQKENITLPSYVTVGPTPQEEITLALCSRLMILPTESGLTLDGISGHLSRHNQPIPQYMPQEPSGPSAEAVELTTLRVEVEESADQLQSMDAELQATLIKNAELQRTIEGLENEVHHVEPLNDALKDENLSLLEQIESLRNGCKKAEAAAAAAHATTKELQVQIQALQALESQNAELVSTVQSLQDSLNRQIEEAANLDLSDPWETASEGHDDDTPQETDDLKESPKKGTLQPTPLSKDPTPIEDSTLMDAIELALEPTPTHSEIQALKDALGDHERRLDSLQQSFDERETVSDGEASWPALLPMGLPSLFDGLNEGEDTTQQAEPQDGELALLDAISPEKLKYLPNVIGSEDDKSGSET